MLTFKLNLAVKTKTSPCMFTCTKVAFFTDILYFETPRNVVCIQKVLRNVNNGMKIVQKQITLTSDNPTIMRPFSLFIRLFIVSLFFFSCSPYVEVVKVDVLNPSASTFTFMGKDVAIIGNLYELERGKYLYDSMLVAEATQGLKEALEQSPVFENYEIPIYYTYTSDTSAVAKILSKPEIDSLASEIGVDMFIVVDYINIRTDKLDDDKDVQFSMMYASLFRVYDVTAERPHASYIFRNNEPEPMIMYGDDGQFLMALGSDAKASLARRLGENYAMLIAPYWETVERVYYISPDDELNGIRNGDRYVQRGDWNKAMESWNKTISSSVKPMQVAMAAFNMAVGCEMMGDLTLAQSWLEYCQKLQNSKINPKPYMQTIASRVQDKRILDEKLQIVE